MLPRMARQIALVLFASTFLACGGATSPTPSSDGGSGTGGSAGTGGGGGGGGAGCDPACGTARECCTDHCVNLQNDPLNCGACGKKCSGGYCTGGRCAPIPCNSVCGGGATCCGAACCAAGELCCDPQGPLDQGPVCVAPVNGTCPMGCAPLCICASPDTPIATPAGDRPIASLRVGDLVYSVDHGKIVTAPILRTNRTPVTGHSVMRVELASGSVLDISPGHPTTDGRTFGGLRPGDALDGVSIGAARLVPYAHDATYDILPDTDSGAYYAGGVLIGSTLASAAARVTNTTIPIALPESTAR